MRYLTFSEIEGTSYEICLLLPTLEKRQILKHYIERYFRGEEDTILAYDLFKQGKQTRRCSFDRNTIQNLVLAIFDQTKRGWSFGTRTGRARDTLVQRLWELYEASGFLSTRILDALDPDNLGHVDLGRITTLIRSLPEKPFDLVSIHDCFRCHPNHGNDIRQQYNQVLSEISASDTLTFIASQILGRDVSIRKLDTIASKVLRAEYALC